MKQGIGWQEVAGFNATEKVLSNTSLEVGVITDQRPLISAVLARRHVPAEPFVGCD
jgi:hypothetical protein